MLVHPQFDPVAIQIGPIAIHWYGLMYLIAFGLVWLAGRWRINHGKTNLSLKDLEDIIFCGVIGVVAGGRLGYILFYKPAHYLSHPLEIFYLWEGGMSFHGGLIGVVCTLAWLARNKNRTLLELGDFIAPLIPLGLAAGRLGNFINGELWGRPSDLPWAMVFPQAQDNIARHPSQLYEMGLEGILLFVIVWWFARIPRPTGQVSAVFLTGYGVLRFLVEYTREPDAFLGPVFGALTMGQLLSLPMIAVGLLIYFRAANKSFPEQKR
jgi:phosphatidylglycerol:prolipoprotein diacylglycerol transferase